MKREPNLTRRVAMVGKSKGSWRQRRERHSVYTSEDVVRPKQSADRARLVVSTAEEEPTFPPMRNLTQNSLVPEAARLTSEPARNSQPVSLLPEVEAGLEHGSTVPVVPVVGKPDKPDFLAAIRHAELVAHRVRVEQVRAVSQPLLGLAHVARAVGMAAAVVVVVTTAEAADMSDRAVAGRPMRMRPTRLM